MPSFDIKEIIIFSRNGLLNFRATENFGYMYSDTDMDCVKCHCGRLSQDPMISFPEQKKLSQAIVTVTGVTVTEVLCIHFENLGETLPAAGRLSGSSAMRPRRSPSSGRGGFSRGTRWSGPASSLRSTATR